MFAEGLDGFKGGINTRKYCRLTKCSRATAFRDLDDMLKRGMLVKRPGLGRNVSYDLVTLDRSMYLEGALQSSLNLDETKVKDWKRDLRRERRFETGKRLNPGS